MCPSARPASGSDADDAGDPDSALAPAPDSNPDPDAVPHSDADPALDPADDAAPGDRADRRLNLLIAAHDLYPDPGSGGCGRYVYETARRLAARGHSVTVVTRRRGDVPRRETVDGVAVRRYDLAVADRPAVAAAARLPSVVPRLREWVRTFEAGDGPHLLSLQGTVTSVLLDRLVDAAVPRVVTFHSPWPTEYRLRTRGDAGRDGLARRLNARLRHRLEAGVLDGADRVVALSEFMRRRCRDAYGDCGAVRVVPGGVDLDRFRPDAGPSDLVADGPALLTVRRLDERMGHDLLLDAFAGLTGRFPDARLYVAGDGPLRDRLERLAADRGVADRTTFLGYVPDADLPALYADASTFVLPTRRLEGFGLATLEALASGTPVVATPVGGTPELLADLDRDGGMPADALLPEASADALRDRLADWLALSPAERTAAGRRCRAYVGGRYTWARTTAAVEREYLRTLD